MKRLIDAAKELTRYLCKVQDWSWSYVETCIDNVDAAIAEAQQQAADDAELITWDWLLSIGWAVEDQYINNRDIKMLRAVGVRLYYKEVCRSSDGIHYDLFYGKEILPHIKTRGQLGELIKLLKGGEQS